MKWLLTVVIVLAGLYAGFWLVASHGLDRALQATIAEAEEDEDTVLTMLRERELVSSAYLERQVTLQTEAGPLESLAYVIDPHHIQYVQLDLETQAKMIARSIGGRGPNPEYLHRTAAHLEEMGIADPDMRWLDTRVRALTTPD